MIKEFIMLSGSVLLAGVRSVASKGGTAYTKREDFYLYHFLVFFFAFVVVLIAGCFAGFSVSDGKLLCASLYALLTFLSQMLFVKAVAYGDVAICSMFYSCGFLLPTFFGLLAYHESIRWTGVVGIAAILAALGTGMGCRRSPTGRSMPYALLAMLCSGGVGIVQKVYRQSDMADDLFGMLIPAFLLILAWLLLRMPKRKIPARDMVMQSSLVGLSFGTVNVLNLSLAGLLPSSVLFPFINGGAILSSSLLARFALKQKLGVKGRIALIMAVFGIVLIAL